MSVSGGHVAVVLAAGGSQRLGRPKQLLTRDGEPLVRRALRLAAETQPARLLLVVGANANAVAAAVGFIECELVHNVDWRRGLASSLRAAAMVLAGDPAPALLLACDQPALTASHLQALVDGAAGAASGCAASAYGPVIGVPAVCPGAWLREVGEVGDQGLGGRLRNLPAETMARVEAAELQFDLDTPGDLRAAKAGGLIDGDGLTGC